MQGETTDGNRYIGKAIAQGATAVVTDSAAAFAETARRYAEVGVAEVPAGGGRRAMAAIGANFFGQPDTQLALTGVTGTNGKTTTAFLLDAMLNAVRAQNRAGGNHRESRGGSGAARPAYDARVARPAGALARRRWMQEQPRP